MTKPKALLPLPARTPAYVSREVGAAELCISPETWDAWVRSGTLPRACPATDSSGAPRWRWADVDAALCGQATHALPSAPDPYMPRAGDGERAKRGRRAAA